MKKVVLATSLATALLSGAAAAADLPAVPAVSYVKPAPAALLYNWGGFYVGGNGGWGTSHKCWDFAGTTAAPIAPFIPEGCHDADGGTVGGQFGYRWQYTYLILGLEGQGNWADFTGANLSVFFPGISNRTKVDSFGFLTVQAGYAWDNVLFYVKGGGAAVHDKYSFGPALGVTTGTASETRWGAVVGVGIEFGFAPNWSFAVEYDHAFLGARNITFNQVVAPFPVDHIHQDLDVVTARINYRFGGPLYAKY
jgi:outer membrane immunogenic protein